jgi:ribosome biogenesis GTPase A
MPSTGERVVAHSIEGMLRTLLGTNLVAGNPAARDRLLSLESKLASGQLHLAVVGQMKRGKSSLINALLRGNVLPTGVLPATAIITTIRYGRALGATVCYQVGGMSEEVALNDLACFVTESGNPGNRKQVASVDITFPASFLENGIVLIDTPGIGSTYAHNTETTRRFLGEIDAGIVVLSVDPPITESESRFIQELMKEIPVLLFVLNKTDIAPKREVEEVVRFLGIELNRLGISSPEIFALSAHPKSSLEGDGSSGLEAFERRLLMFLSQEKQEVLAYSVAMDVLEIAKTLRFSAAIGARAAAMAPSVLAEKQLAFARLIEHIEREIWDLRRLLVQRSADLLSNLERDLTKHVQESIPDVRQHLRSFAKVNPKETGRKFGASLEQFLMTEVESVFDKWRIRQDEKLQRQLNDLSASFEERANHILTRLVEMATTLFQTPVETLNIRCTLRVESHLSFRVERIFYSLDSFLLLLPRFLLRRIVLGRTLRNIAPLLDTNAGRIRYDYMERLQASTAKFENELFGSLGLATQSLRSALNPEPGLKSPDRASAIELLGRTIADCETILARDAG